MDDEQRSGISAPKTISLVRLPEDLTGEQAMAVFDFLERLAAAIWNRYEKQMIPIILDKLPPEERQCVLDESDDGLLDDDEIPF